MPSARSSAAFRASVEARKSPRAWAYDSTSKDMGPPGAEASLSAPTRRSAVTSVALRLTAASWARPATSAPEAVRAEAVFLSVDSDGAETQFGRGSHDPDRDLRAIGDQ